MRPLRGIETMKARRRTGRLRNLCSGPGKFTQSFAIDGTLNGQKVYGAGARVYVRAGSPPRDIRTSARIGVTEDLAEPLRFYAAKSPFVSAP